MKIVHIAPNAPYNDYWGYHENLLPKYHKKLGHDVTIITTNTMHKDGKIVETECDDYVLNDGVRVVRVQKKKHLHPMITNINSRLPIFDYLDEIRPDFVFFHGLISTSIFDVIKYKNEVKPDCVIVQDNHLDYYNNFQNNMFYSFLLRSFRRYLSKRTLPYVSKVYGVTPWRKTYAEEYFKIPKSKTDVLIMGADDEKIDFKNKDRIKERIRKEYNIADTDFLIVTGGKIDKNKKIDILMKSVGNIENVKIIVFGNVSNDIKEVFDSLISDYNNIIYIGWISSDKVYDYFLSADLICFPGTHSVLWEQACASKVPCLFSKWDGMYHVNNGGNSDFVEDITVEKLTTKILELRFTDKYYKMKSVAESKNTDVYLYSKIAEKSLESAQL